MQGTFEQYAVIGLRWVRIMGAVVGLFNHINIQPESLTSQFFKSIFQCGSQKVSKDVLFPGTAD